MNVKMKVLCFFLLCLLNSAIGDRDTKIILTREELKAIVREEVDILIDAGELVRRSEVDKIAKLIDEGELVRRSEVEKIAKSVCQINDMTNVQTLPKTSLDAKRFATNPGLAVGFTACISVPDLVNLGDQHTIIFDQIITNKGAAYHDHTGIFIAPAKGLYVFHLTAMSIPDRAQYLAFIHDGNVVNHAYPDARGTQGYQTTGSHWVMELEQGSEVWIRTQGAGEIHGNCFTVFSGFLLYETE